MEDMVIYDEMLATVDYAAYDSFIAAYAEELWCIYEAPIGWE